MFNKNFFHAATLFVAAVMITSCSSDNYLTMPQAINTVNSVNLSELRLNHETDYTILNTISADATVVRSSHKKGESVIVEEADGEFKIEFKWDSKKGQYVCNDFEGIARLGFLDNDYSSKDVNFMSPHSLARYLAIYRVINAAKVVGADGIIEPIVSTNVQGHGSKRDKEIVFKTTVSAKPVKLNVDAK